MCARNLIGPFKQKEHAFTAPALTRYSPTVEVKKKKKKSSYTNTHCESHWRVLIIKPTPYPCDRAQGKMSMRRMPYCTLTFFNLSLKDSNGKQIWEISRQSGMKTTWV